MLCTVLLQDPLYLMVGPRKFDIPRRQVARVRQCVTGHRVGPVRYVKVHRNHAAKQKDVCYENIHNCNCLYPARVIIYGRDRRTTCLVCSAMNANPRGRLSVGVRLRQVKRHDHPEVPIFQHATKPLAG